VPEPFRTCEYAGFTLRWAGFQCDAPHFCQVAVHRVALVGFDFDGVDRWIPVTELIDATVEEAERTVMDAVWEDETTVPGWRLLAAAFGLPWPAFDIRQVRICSQACFALPPRVTDELVEQGVDGLLTLRRLAGRSNLSELPFLLSDLNRYRRNVGGERKEHDG
jgi:hypothetical protein